jgi:DNA invertase Pin-like site-specific DNA recombinase
MKIAIYARVSTEKQETENQLAQLREFAAREGWQVVREYVDTESGSKANRPEFLQMFTDAKAEQFDLLLFWALDRLTREGVLPTLRYLEQLTDHGVAWRSFTEAFFDSCGPFRDAVIAIMATLAKQERIKRAERTKAGLARVKAAGRVLGRPRALKVSREDVARLRAAGSSHRAIGAQLGVSEASVRRVLAA